MTPAQGISRDPAESRRDEIDFLFPPTFITSRLDFRARGTVSAVVVPNHSVRITELAPR